MKRVSVIWVVLSLLLCCRVTAAGEAAAPLSGADAAFLNEAALAGMFEIQASQTALQKGSDPAVKSFAQLLLTQHRESDEMLKRLSSSKGHSLPAQLDDERQNLIGDMQQKDADDFDRNFVEHAGVKAHQQAIRTFRDAAVRSRDPDIKQFASDQLKPLQAHLDRAQNIDRALDDTGPASRNGTDRGLPSSPPAPPSSPPVGAGGADAPQPPQPAPGTPSKDAESQ